MVEPTSRCAFEDIARASSLLGCCQVNAMNARDDGLTERRRVSAEAVRSEAEQARSLAEDARERRDQDREALETGRQEREHARETAEATRVAGEEARAEAEAVREAVVGEVVTTADSLTVALEQMKAVEEMRRTFRQIRNAHTLNES
jgi:hypothetical protein